MEDTQGIATAEDLASLKDEYILLRKLIKKDQLKHLKVSARERELDFICTVCGRGFKDVQSAQDHTKSALHQYNAKEQQLEALLSTLLSTPPTTVHLNAITQLVMKTYEEKSAVAQDQISTRLGIATELQSFTKDCLLDVTVELHGSSVSGFALTNSNMNINLSIPGADEQLTLIPVAMKKTVEILKQHGEVYEKVKEDFYSVHRIPRILFQHCESGLKCEVRAMAQNPMALATFLQLYGEIDLRALQLGVIFKYWAKVCKVDQQEDGHYPGHMFVVMVIHFLQHTVPPILPVLHELKPEQERVVSNDDDIVHFSKDDLKELRDSVRVWKTDNRDTLGELWYKLLRYYVIEFDQRKCAVTIRQFETLLRESRQWGVARLAVEDPLIPRSNLARGSRSDRVYSYLMSCLKQTLAYFCSWNQSSLRGGIEAKPCPSVTDDGNAKAQKSLKQEGSTFDSSSETVECQDSSIVVAAFPAVIPADSAPPPDSLLSGSLEQQLSNSSTNTALDGITVGSFLEVNSAVENVTVEEDRVIPSQVSNPSMALGTDNVLDKQGKGSSPSHTACSTSKAEEDGSVDLTATASPLSFELKYLTYQHYPKVCLNCNRHNHTATECPTDDLPKLTDISHRLKATHTIHLRALEQIFVDYMRSVMPNSSHLKMRQGICDMISKDIANIYPSAQLQLFGSSANGFGSYRSDLDICMTLDELTDDKSVKGEIIEAVADELLKRPDQYHNILAVTSARVPIVKCYLPARRLECDISLENRLALRNTKMLASYARIDDRVPVLGYVVKHFAKVCDMGDASTGSLSSYAYILLLLHYLQRTSPPVVPVLQQLGRDENSEVMINSWDCYFHELNSPNDLALVWPHYRTNKTIVGKLWLDFLRFCLEFDWEHQVVCINKLEPVTKFDKWWIGKQMCIEDPFNLDHNLGAAVGTKMRAYILERFMSALCYHSRNMKWFNLSMVMDPTVLVGEDRAPKFMICMRCNGRGHKAQNCPNKRIRKKKPSKIKQQESEDVNKPVHPQPQSQSRVQQQEREQVAQPMFTGIPQPQPSRIRQHERERGTQPMFIPQPQPSRGQQQERERAQPQPQPSRVQQQERQRAQPQPQPSRVQQQERQRAQPQPQPSRVQQHERQRATQQPIFIPQPQPSRVQQQERERATQQAMFIPPPQPSGVQQQERERATQQPMFIPPPQPSRVQQQERERATQQPIFIPQPQPSRVQQQERERATQQHMFIPPPQPSRVQQQERQRATQQAISRPPPSRDEQEWIDQRVLPQPTPSHFGHPHSAVPIPHTRALLPPPTSSTPSLLNYNPAAPAAYYGPHTRALLPPPTSSTPSLLNYNPAAPAAYYGPQLLNHMSITAASPMSPPLQIPSVQFQYASEGQQLPLSPHHAHAVPLYQDGGAPMPLGSQHKEKKYHPSHSVHTDQRKHPSVYPPSKGVSHQDL